MSHVPIYTAYNQDESLGNDLTTTKYHQTGTERTTGQRTTDRITPLQEHTLNSDFCFKKSTSALQEKKIFDF